MKLQLDTINKTIKLESDMNLGELVKNLEKLLPKGEWKEFTLQTHTVINNWSSPTIIERYYPQKQIYWETYPWYKTYCQNTAYTSSSASLNNGTYNVEVKGS